MKICVYSQQKTGSTSIYNILINNNYTVSKDHYNPKKNLKYDDYDIVIIPFRNIKEIIISGYFENIIKKKFFYDFDLNMKENISERIEKIKNIPWDKHVLNIINYE